MSGKGSQTRAAKAMKEELLKWICMSHATNASLDRLSLRKKALDLVCFFGLTGFKCSEAWLTVFLKRHGFSPNLTDCSGPKFDDYRLWIDLIRPLMEQHRYKDQFHVDELMMYTEFNPMTNLNNGEMTENIEKFATIQYDTSMMHRVSLLIACNSSGTEKLRPLICAPYSITDSERQDCFYHCSENAKISDELFGNWLSKLNHEMASNNRRILIILNRKRIGALKYVQLTHIMTLFIPNEFPTQLRPLRRDVFHFIKMIYRIKHVERLCQSTSRTMCQPDEMVKTLIQAWQQVPRELIVANFQRTKFREDDCFLNIECDLWDNLKTGVTFEHYVTFDDDLSDSYEFELDDLRFLMSVNKHKYNLRNANNPICDDNDVEEDHSESSRELESSLKRPSDDSIDMSSDLQDKNPEKEVLTHSQIESSGETSDQFFSSGNQEEKCDGKRMINNSEDKIENAVDYVIEDVKNSPIRNASTPINRDYDKGEINRIYPSPERTSILSTNLDLITDPHCFEKVSKSLEHRLIHLEKNCFKSFEHFPKRQLENLFDDTPIPSTSKEGLEESCILQKFHDTSTDREIFHNKIMSVDLEIVEEVNDKTIGFKNDCRLLKNYRLNDNNIDENSCEDNVRDCSEGPTNKRQRMETNWAKCYEKHLVFGPDISNQCDGLSDEIEHDGLTDVIQS